MLQIIKRFVFLFDPLFLTKNKSRLNLFFYLCLLLAIFLGATGAAGDSSWHFSRFFDEFALPHIIAASGNVIDICLITFAFFHLNTLSKGEALGFKLNALALIVLAFDIPADLINHLVSGIDLTAWSPTHLILFYQGTLAILGMTIAWVSSTYRNVSYSWVLTIVYAAFFLSSVLFPLYQQEYATVVLHSLSSSGNLPWYVAPDLVLRAGSHITKILTNGTPEWLYVTYQAPATVFAVFLSVLFIAKNTKWPFTIIKGVCVSMVVVLVYLLFRLAARSVLGYFGLPTAELPLWLLPLAGVIGIASSLVTSRTSDGSTNIKNPKGLNTALLVVIGSVAGGSLFGVLYVVRATGAIAPTAPLYTLPGVIILSGIAPLLALALTQFIERTTE